MVLGAVRGEGELWFLSGVWLREEEVGDGVEEENSKPGGKGLNGWFRREKNQSRPGGGCLVR
jgi:hypothetical protein